MAEAWGWVHKGELVGCWNYRKAAEQCVERLAGEVVPMHIETAVIRHADDLHQVLKDLTGLAKMAAAPLNTYQAAVRNASELLAQIERETSEAQS